MNTGTANIFRRSLMNIAAARDVEGAPKIVRLGADSRALFRNHLRRLDERTRRQRFGACGLKDDFLESYIENMDFSNTALFGLLASYEVRASAELRSLAPKWGIQAELAVIFEPEWKRCCDALCREAFRFATQLGLLEIYTYCDLASDCTHSLLRCLGKERGYAPCGGLAAAGSPCDSDRSMPSSNVILLRLVRTSSASGGRR